MRDRVSALTGASSRDSVVRLRRGRLILPSLRGAATSLMLGRKLGEPGRRWFVRHGSRKRVRGKDHLEYLMSEYLPSHRGLKWCEGDAAPVEPPDAPIKKDWRNS
jgi:hypothetical protein